MGTKTDETTGYGIGAVARLTGLTTHTLRMWEHRYQAVVARRQSNGRRLYSAADVEKLSMLKALTDRGTTISNIAGLSTEQLRKRLEQDLSLEAPGQAELSVASMGSTVPALLRRSAKQNGKIRCIATGTDPGELDTDIAGRPLDCLVMEFPVLDAHTLGLIRKMRKQHQPKGTVVVYRFARSADVLDLSQQGILPLHSPVSGPELLAAIFSASGGRAGGAVRRGEASDQAAIKRRAVLAPVPDRQFSAHQLARLAEISTSVDCECPHHLAEILSSLTAFEVYSRHCEKADEAQAELHAYLHNATGRARGIMEEALSHLLEIEHISRGT